MHIEQDCKNNVILKHSSAKISASRRARILFTLKACSAQNISIYFCKVTRI